MQGVVLAVKDNKASILEKGGGMRIIRDEGYVPGQVLQLPDMAANEDARPERKKKVFRGSFSRWRVVNQAAAMLVLVVGMGMITANGIPCSLMTMDINPSLKYTVNSFGRVIDLEAFNGDGEEIMEHLVSKVWGKKIDEAMDYTLEALQEASYLDGEENTLVITVSSMFTGNADKIKTQVLSKAESWNESNESGNVNMNVVEVEKEVVADAASKGVSPGKLYLTRQLNAAISANEEFDEEEWLNKSVADIEAATKAKTTKLETVEKAKTAELPAEVSGEEASAEESTAQQQAQAPVSQSVVKETESDSSDHSSSDDNKKNESESNKEKKKKKEEKTELAEAEETGGGEESAAMASTVSGNEGEETSASAGEEKGADPTGTEEASKQEQSGEEGKTTQEDEKEKEGESKPSEESGSGQESEEQKQEQAGEDTSEDPGQHNGEDSEKVDDSEEDGESQGEESSQTGEETSHEEQSSESSEGGESSQLSSSDESESSSGSTEASDSSEESSHDSPETNSDTE